MKANIGSTFLFQAISEYKPENALMGAVPAPALHSTNKKTQFGGYNPAQS